MSSSSTSTTDPLYSAIDEQHAVPGGERPTLAHACAVEFATVPGATFETDAWQQVLALDARDGFATRRAARGVLRRASDGRFLVFRYRYSNGTERIVLPGGGAEAGEAPLDAVTREVLEETGAAPTALTPSGLFLFHLLASTVIVEGRTPTIQYSPVFTGVIADELPDTDGREAFWYSADEFDASPRRPVTDAFRDLLRAIEREEDFDPRAVWLPA